MVPLIVATSNGTYSLQTVNITDDKLIINITRGYFEENMVYSYHCSYVFPNNTSDGSGVVRIDPLGVCVCVCVFVHVFVFLCLDMKDFMLMY